MNQYAVPTKESRRLPWIDGARGFAIFGIFVVNIGAFSAPYFLYGGTSNTSSVDQFIEVLIDIFFQASFYTLFSLLFGFGFQMMKDSLVEKNLSVFPVLGRRLMMLIIFGLIHAFLIWHGDILLTYGIIGLLLLAFLHVKGKTLLAWALLLMGVSVGLISISLYEFRHYLGQANFFAAEQAIKHYQSGNLLKIWEQNYTDWLYANGGESYFLLIGTLLPLFLVGMLIAKKRWLHEPEKHQPILRRLWLLSLVMFAGLKAGPYMFGNPAWFSMIQDNIGGAFSALFYILSITFLFQMPRISKLFKPLQYVGRMALTNYIAQSLICFVLFYIVGLYSSITPASSMLIVVIIYSIQVVWSKWWLARFRFGPLEWLWRSVTYKKVQKLRRKEEAKIL
ncbi:DUF418 domain-containing protein [Oceanobacillus kapialis]|uniref:DUF418 domain-containing protein n=1 Tax=Oceanobacillus kapialis TaxID=481353 RepID=A0ABW5Q3X5_9BACI